MSDKGVCKTAPATPGLLDIAPQTIAEKFIVWITRYKYLRKRPRIWSSAHGSAFTTLVMNPKSAEYFSLVKCSDVEFGAMLCIAVQCSAVQCYIVRCSVMHYCVVQWRLVAVKCITSKSMGMHHWIYQHRLGFVYNSIQNK